MPEAFDEVYVLYAEKDVIVLIDRMNMETRIGRVLFQQCIQSRIFRVAKGTDIIIKVKQAQLFVHQLRNCIVIGDERPRNDKTLFHTPYYTHCA